VIRIYDLSEADGMKFITMEYVEGEDLRGLMQKKGKLEPEEAVEIMQQPAVRWTLRTAQASSTET